MLDFEKISNRDHEEANEINKMINEKLKSEPSLSAQEAMSEVNSDIDWREQLKDPEAYQFKEVERAFEMMKFHIDDWMKRRKFKSEDLKNVLLNMKTSTGASREFFSYLKTLVAIELGEKIENREIRNKEVYYLGAGYDFRLPLAMHFRKINMVDISYSSEIVNQILKELKKFENFKIKSKNKKEVFINFNFDFGRKKKEEVEIRLIHEDMNKIQEPKQEIGGVISFFSGYNRGAFCNVALHKKLANGGIIFDPELSPIKNLAIELISEDLEKEDSFNKRNKLIRNKEKEIAKKFWLKVEKIPGTDYIAYSKIKDSEEWLNFIESRNK